MRPTRGVGAFSTLSRPVEEEAVGACGIPFRPILSSAILPILFRSVRSHPSHVSPHPVILHRPGDGYDTRRCHDQPPVREATNTAPQEASNLYGSTRSGHKHSWREQLCGRKAAAVGVRAAQGPRTERFEDWGAGLIQQPSGNAQIVLD